MNKRFSDHLIHFIVYRGRLIEIIFAVLTIFCLICYPFVDINYDLSEYLPSSAPTRQALNVMEREFGYPGMARVMVPNVTRYDAKNLRSKIEGIDGVSMVIGADLLSDVYMGDSFAENKLTDQFYKDGNALFEIVFDNGENDQLTHHALDEIKTVVGEKACFTGTAASSKARQESITREILIAILISIVIIWLILTLTTNSWFEPFLFLAIMFIAIIINMGSNLMFGSISFFTFSTAAILQLAVSMDYSIFLLHIFMAHKKAGMDLHEAMVVSIREASSSILASGATTIVGFIAIAFMQFSIGRDVGFVLTKGILASLVTVLFLMPTLILHFNDKIERTAHRPLMPSFASFARGMNRIRVPVLVAAVLLAIPCFIGQGLNAFYYGNDALGAGPGTQIYEDTEAINAVFGKSNVTLAIIPDSSNVRERELTRALEDLPFNNYALGLANTLPDGIPESFLPEKLTKEFHHGGYARIMISSAMNEESPYSFSCADTMMQTIQKYYPKDAYVIGMTQTTMDIKNILTRDYSLTSILSMIGVIIVVLLTFRSVLVPILVIVPIEVAIYLNMTLPYVMGDSLLYIGYIIVSCLQLGATIDYSILMTNNYLALRKTTDSKQAAQGAIARSALSILTSGTILTVVGYLLYFTSSIQAVSQVGRLVGRGALLSMVLVLSLLPALLCTFDKSIGKQQARAAVRRAKRIARLSALKNRTTQSEKGDVLDETHV